MTHIDNVHFTLAMDDGSSLPVRLETLPKTPRNKEHDLECSFFKEHQKQVILVSKHAPDGWLHQRIAEICKIALNVVDAKTIADMVHLCRA